MLLNVLFQQPTVAYDRTSLDTLLKRYYPRESPEGGKSIVEVRQPFFCDCSSFLYETVASCLLPKDLNGCYAQCTLIDCGGQFSPVKFEKYLRDFVARQYVEDVDRYNPETLVPELLFRFSVVQVFTPRELTLALYALRDFLKRIPVSCLFVQHITAFSDLEKLMYGGSKGADVEQTLWTNLLLCLLRDFNLLCIITRRCWRKSHHENIVGDWHNSIRAPHETIYHEESVPPEWVKHVTHKIELLNCFSKFVSHVKRESTFKIVVDGR
ncbi:hypothetical protein EG68_05030 [Paragonimus skrjabini miyazakii]|uniref:DNA recombination and repair protein Rad51-like C-terminal domain-containing protein n=1 Tax=Paragonimus skrjabini miyazakii TaxID=59628 RepID=A0A8S9YX18_9TREM|nr:hypothetical protein EG68_05030 [Paragonimus skrjabini miyazakii]